MTCDSDKPGFVQYELGRGTSTDSVEMVVATTMGQWDLIHSMIELGAEVRVVRIVAGRGRL